MSLIRKLAVAYAFMFFALVAIGYVSAFNDADGYLFGLYRLQRYDGLLHGFSGVWALLAALVSHRQSVLYFKLFGSVYLFDGLLGLITGSGCLDGGILMGGFRSVADIDFPARFVANAPHLAIGGLAVIAGFWLSRRLAEGVAAA